MTGKTFFCLRSDPRICSLVGQGNCEGSEGAWRVGCLPMNGRDGSSSTTMGFSAVVPRV